MNYNNGIANYLAGPSGRFNLADPSTQAMVRDVMGAPGNAPKYGVSLPEIFQLHRALNAISSQTPHPKPTTVADDLKMAALQAIQAPNAAPPQMSQMPPQGIQQAMPQAQAPQNPMDQGLGGMPAPAMDNAQFAGGGIVAFADNGLVTVPPGAPPEGVSPFSGTSKELYEQILANQLAQKAAFRVPTLQEAMEEERAAREAAGIKGKLGEERLKKLEGAGKKDAEMEARDERLALAKAGFKMAEAASRRGAARTGFLGAAAEGATAGLTDYVAAQEKLRALQAERDKEIANIQNLQRAEDLGFVKNASGKIEKAQNHLLDIEKNISTTQASIAGQMSAAEGRQAEITARAEEGRLNRAAQERLAGMRIVADRTLEEFRQAGNVDATMLADYNKAMAAPVAEREAALKAWNDKYSSIAKIKSESRSAEKMGAATEATYRAREKAFAESMYTNQTLKNLYERATKGDAAAKREYNAAYETFVGRPPPGASASASSAPGGGNTVDFSKLPK